MKDTKRCMHTFTFYDHTGIEARLEKMAEEGWKLEKISGVFWTYRRIEPQKLHYAVCYYPPASTYDPGPSEGERTFQEFCLAAGWELAGSAAQIQVFCSAEENPRPIETDALLQVETIHRAAKKSIVLSYFLVLVLAVFQFANFAWRIYNDPIYVLSDSASIFTIVCFLCMFALGAVELTAYFLWYRKAKAAAQEDGSFVKTRGTQTFQRVMLVVLLCSLILWALSLRSSRQVFYVILSFAYVGLVIGLMLALTALLKRKKVSARMNRIISIVACVALSLIMMVGLTVVVVRTVNTGWLEREPVATYEIYGMTRNIYHDELPLTIEDLMPSDYKGYSYELEKNTSSIFLARRVASQVGRMDEEDVPELEYAITDVKMPMLYDFCVDGIVRRYTDDADEYEEFSRYLVEIDADTFGALTAYQRYRHGEPSDFYILCWEGRIVELDFNFTPTPSELVTAAQILKTA